MSSSKILKIEPYGLLRLLLFSIGFLTTVFVSGCRGQHHYAESIPFSEQKWYTIKLTDHLDPSGIPLAKCVRSEADIFELWERAEAEGVDYSLESGGSYYRGQVGYIKLTLSEKEGPVEIGWYRNIEYCEAGATSRGYSIFGSDGN